jgi:hypothetical protein
MNNSKTKEGCEKYDVQRKVNEVTELQLKQREEGRKK